LTGRLPVCNHTDHQPWHGYTFLTLPRNGFGMKRKLLRIAFCLAALALISSTSGMAATGRRVALVVGNGAYQDAPLSNPVNDAKDIAEALQKVGFEVTLKTNADKRTMIEAIEAFGDQIAGAEAALFYFSGHGVQIKGENYILPTGYRISSEVDVEFECINAYRLIKRLEGPMSRVNIVILDACRTNPFARKFKSLDRGLARIDAPTGTLLAYATNPDNVASDGSGRNSPYTAALKKYLQMPGLPVEQVFKRVRTEVVTGTSGKQTPWESTSLMGDFYFVASSVAQVPVPAPEPATQPAPAPQPSQAAPPPSASIAPSGDKKEFTNSIGMKFVLIPAGTFIMGSPASEPDRSDNETQHQVTLSRSYYMQTTEVTQGQWTAIMGNNPSQFKDCGDNCPVENISWQDAQEYIKRLNMREGTNKYRLPTEAEWEYACRAGSQSRFSFGDAVGSLDLYGWYEGNSGNRTHPVGQKEPNAWGLYDMHGNVCEWVQDRYGDYPVGAVTDPTGPSSGTGILRGGSTGSIAWICRCACRVLTARYERIKIGFRVVLDLK